MEQSIHTLFTFHHSLFTYKVSSLTLCYVIAINLITFLVYGIDKWIAIRNGKTESQHHSSSKSRRTKHRRISEVTLLTLAAIGGSIGAWCGMMLFRHKTQHLKFKFGVPLIVLLQLALIVYLCVN